MGVLGGVDFGSIFGLEMRAKMGQIGKSAFFSGLAQARRLKWA